MGTSYHITLRADSDTAGQLAEKIEQRLARLNQLMSTYLADSELSRFNQSRSTDCFPFSTETATVIRAAQSIYEQSGGAFDPTLAPLIEIWGFDKRDTQDQLPSAELIAQLREQTGMDKLKIGADCIAKTLPELSLNLSAIAKGYAVDEIGRLLSAQGISDFMVEIGGEVVTRGKNPRGKAWHIAVEKPVSDTQAVQRIIAISNRGMATSGDYRNYFEKDGKRYSHTIDPRSGYPINHKLASVTVIADTSMQADAWATAMMVLGEKEGLQLAEKQQLAVYMLVRSGDGFCEQASSAFMPYLGAKNTTGENLGYNCAP